MQPGLLVLNRLEQWWSKLGGQQYHLRGIACLRCYACFLLHGDAGSASARGCRTRAWHTPPPDLSRHITDFTQNGLQPSPHIQQHMMPEQMLRVLRHSDIQARQYHLSGFDPTPPPQPCAAQISSIMQAVLAPASSRTRRMLRPSPDWWQAHLPSSCPLEAAS